MKTPFTCSYIIPYTHSSHNLKLLRHVLGILDHDVNIQKIVVETGSVPHLNNMDLKSDYVFIESDIWNLGWLYNCGSKLSKTDNLFFGSFEFVPRIGVINTIVSSIDKSDCIYLQESIVNLDRDDSVNRKFDGVGKKEKSDGVGIVYYTRNGFFKSGGWDENIFGKDVFTLQYKKNKCSVNMGQVSDVITFRYNVDLPHHKDSLTKYSKEHRDKIMNLDDGVLRNYINNQVRRNGNYSKYRTQPLMLV